MWPGLLDFYRKNRAMKTVREVLRLLPTIPLVQTANSYGLEGQKTADFETCDKLGQAPKHHGVANRAAKSVLVSSR